MILIWDNGEQYSDHSIRFFEIDDLPVELVAEALKLRDSDGYVLGTAEKIEWYEGTTARLAATLTPGCYLDCWSERDFPDHPNPYEIPCSGPVPKREDALLIEPEPDYNGKPSTRMVCWYYDHKALAQLPRPIYEHLRPDWLKAEWIGQWAKQIELIDNYFKENP